ncbi:MAG TPA: inositol monophosphatase [Candidatus Paceibacterota bacterium]
MQNLQDERALAINLATRGGEAIQEVLEVRKAIQRRWSTERRTELKTHIDLTVDRIVRDGIQSAFPNDAILSEESAFREGTSGRVWVVDSIDGTLNLQGPLFGMFAVCIAITEGGIPDLGVAYSPNVQTGQGGRIWIGEKEKQSLYSPDYPKIGPTEIHVSDCHIRNQAIGGFDSGKHHRTAVYPYLQKLEHDTEGVTCLYRIASASRSLLAVATGDWDFYGATSLEPEDMAAAVPILQGAGAVVTTIDGRPWTIDEPSILAANPVLHKDLLQYLNS